jgi:hypothetical protein
MSGETVFNAATNQWEVRFGTNPGAETIAELKDSTFRLRRIDGDLVWVATPGYRSNPLGLRLSGGSISAIAVVERPRDHEARADARLGMAKRREVDMIAAHRQADAATAGIEPGQPILVGHHSEARHRKAVKRSIDAIGRAADAEKKMRYHTHRAEASQCKAGDLEDPRFIARRLTEIETEIKRDKGHDPVMTALRSHRLAYWKMMAARHPVPALMFHAGGYVKYRGRWYSVVRVNRDTVSVRDETVSCVTRIRKDQITETRAPWQRAPIGT